MKQALDIAMILFCLGLLIFDLSLNSYFYALGMAALLILWVFWAVKDFNLIERVIKRRGR